MVLESKEKYSLGVGIAVLLAVGGGLCWYLRKDNTQGSPKRSNLRHSEFKKNKPNTKGVTPSPGNAKTRFFQGEITSTRYKKNSTLGGTFKRSGTNQSNRSINTSMRNSIVEIQDKTPIYFSKIDSVKTRYQTEIGNDNLSVHLLILIHEALIEYSHEPFRKLLMHYRSIRREARGKNEAKYIEAVLKHKTLNNELIQRGIYEVLEDSDIAQSLYDESIEHWSQMNPEFADHNATIILQLMAKIELPESTEFEKITLKKVCDVYDYMIGIFNSIPIKTTGSENTLALKETFMRDLVFQHYKVEEEELLKVKGVNSSKDIKKKANALKSLIQGDVQVKNDNFGGF